MTEKLLPWMSIIWFTLKLDFEPSNYFWIKYLFLPFGILFPFLSFLLQCWIFCCLSLLSVSDKFYFFSFIHFWFFIFFFIHLLLILWHFLLWLLFLTFIEFWHLISYFYSWLSCIIKNMCLAAPFKIGSCSLGLFMACFSDLFLFSMEMLFLS